MNKTHIMIVLVFVILAGLLYISLRLGVPGKIADSFGADSDTDQNKEPESNPQDYASQQAELSGANSDANSPGGGGGGGSGGAANSENSPGAQNPSHCYSAELSYSLENFQQTSTCNSYQGIDCIDKTVHCSLEVKNLDENMDGDFEIVFNYIADEEQIGYSSQTQNVLPREIRQFSGSQQFIGTEASRDITCTFQTGQTPSKQVCS